MAGQHQSPLFLIIITSLSFMFSIASSTSSLSPTSWSTPPSSSSIPSHPASNSQPPQEAFAPISIPPQPSQEPMVPISSPPSPSPMPLPPQPPPPLAPYNISGLKGAYWPSFNNFPIFSINTSLFTHIFYAFLLPDPITYQLSLTPNDLQFLPQFSPTLKSLNPSIKTILSIGGAGNDQTVFSAIASCGSHRATFINSAIAIARQFGFDGLDLDWEFPTNQGDMNNLGLLYQEWSNALYLEATITGRARLSLSTAVYFMTSFFLDPVVRTYPAQLMGQYLDWISPMCFDYHGSWSNLTGAHTALYDPNSNISTSSGIYSWIAGGVPPAKLVVGLALYGRTWQLKDPGVNGVGAPAIGAGPGFEGAMVYADIVEFNMVRKASVVYDQNLVSVYSYSGDAWIGYEDPSTIEKRVQFAKTHGLGGYFFWALGQDKDWSITARG
ncbi:hypothetical protein Syun_025402 [Stephania yunnanensis]|uniref:GH18 domain-containing protein n=1 Tax=Stephania yunnanensis TaxID=152371 RepID=A0AAP0EWY5_9MAGN